MWHLFHGQEGDCGDRLWVLTWGWTQHCHCQTSIDVPHHCRCLPSTCRLLTWHFYVIWMVYWHVQVVVGGQQWQWYGDNGWASWMVVVMVEEEEGCCLLTPWDTEYIEVMLLSCHGCLVQLLECSLIHASDVSWSWVFNSHTWHYFWQQISWYFPYGISAESIWTCSWNPVESMDSTWIPYGLTWGR